MDRDYMVLIDRNSSNSIVLNGSIILGWLPEGPVRGLGTPAHWVLERYGPSK